MLENLSCAIAFNTHDSSVSFSKGRAAVLVLEAERIFKEKHKCCNSEEMENLIQIGLSYLGWSLSDISNWALSSLGNTWLSETQQLRLSTTDFFWDKVFFLGELRDSLIVGHHYCHAAAFFFSPFERASVQTCDGGGDFAERAVVFEGNELDLNRVEVVVDDFQVTGTAYGLISNYIYGENGSCEGKFMALAGMGNYDQNLAELIDGMLPILCSAGTNIPRGATQSEINKAFSKGIERTFDTLDKNIGYLKNGARNINQDVLNFAHTFQQIFESRRSRDIYSIMSSRGASNIVLSGGVCLNLGANTEILNKVNKPIFIPPNCEDSGQSLGALAKLITLIEGSRPICNLPFLGMGKREQICLDDVCEISNTLAEGKIVLMHSGPAELGPRALGHRSILVRPDIIAKKIEVSEKIKDREKYRPVAPICTVEKLCDYFIGPVESPYMLYTYNVLQTKSAMIEGAVHSDGTARVQTVSNQSDPFMHALLNEFENKASVPMLLNTSLNANGLPIANNHNDTLNIAKHCKARGVDVEIVLDGKLVDKSVL